MYKTLFALSLATIPLVGFSGVPVLAADASPATPDCSKAPAMMMQSAMAPSPAPAMTGGAMSVDAGYLESMKAMLERQNAMAKMEVACGKDPAAKAMAKKSLEDMQSHVDEVTRLLRSIGL